MRLSAAREGRLFSDGRPCNAMRDKVMMNSIWRGGTDRPSFPRLSSDASCDALVIGGGMAGILTAYMLKRSGVDCMLVEADRICRGTTGNTTAKITFAHGLIYDKLLPHFYMYSLKKSHFVTMKMKESMQTCSCMANLS